MTSVVRAVFRRHVNDKVYQFLHLVVVKATKQITHCIL